MSRCPLCDVVNGALDATEAFTLGAGLGAEFRSLAAVREMMCVAHRVRHVVSMGAVMMKVAASDAAHLARDGEK